MTSIDAVIVTKQCGEMYRPKIDLVTGKQAPEYNKSTKILHCLSCDGF